MQIKLLTYINLSIAGVFWKKGVSSEIKLKTFQNLVSLVLVLTRWVMNTVLRIRFKQTETIAAFL